MFLRYFSKLPLICEFILVIAGVYKGFVYYITNLENFYKIIQLNFKLPSVENMFNKFQ